MAAKTGRLEVLAVIPARGGSKSIPRKNLVHFAGEPLIAHTIDHARDAARVTRVLVSTEDPEIAAAAEQYGAEVPFLRPTELAGDEVLDLPVFAHVLEELYRRERYEPDLVVHLRPTAPWRPCGWIDESIDMLAANDSADSLRSVSRVQQHPWRMFEIGDDGFLASIMSHHHPTPWLLRRQDLPPVYYYNCVIDVTRPRTIAQQRSMTGTRILPMILPEEEAIDIDSPRDLEVAEAIFGPRARAVSAQRRGGG